MDESFRGSISPEEEDRHFGIYLSIRLLFYLSIYLTNLTNLSLYLSLGASWSESQKRLVGLFMAAIAGLMFGKPGD
jgi:hypothetical protein